MLELQSPEVTFALQAVAWASQLVRQIQKEMGAQALAKEDHSPVTVADFASQALVGRLLSQAFPRAPLVGEEDSQALCDPGAGGLLAQVTQHLTHFVPEASPLSTCQWIDRGAGEPRGHFWVLDPIDGTKGFLRGGQYAVALALVEDGQVQIGLLGCPNLEHSRLPGVRTQGVIFLAQRGLGAWQTDLPAGPQVRFLPEQFTRLRVSRQDNPEKARMLRSFEASHTNVQKLDQISHLLHVQPDPLRMDSQAKYALLAAGEGEVIIKPLPSGDPHYREKIWDHAAGVLVVEEAGGQVTDLDGRAIDFTSGRTLTRNRGVLASNGYLHAAFLQAVIDSGT